MIRIQERGDLAVRKHGVQAEIATSTHHNRKKRIVFIAISRWMTYEILFLINTPESLRAPLFFWHSETVASCLQHAAILI